MTPESLIARDRAHVWHPYAAMADGAPLFAVRSAAGVRLTLQDGSELIDGMASWWCAIHGYNHPVLNAAINKQLDSMAHVMFGGLTHEPAVQLAERLVALTPAPLQTVFFADSGSVSVEVAIKMAIQYWAARGLPDKQKLLALEHGYHGDTFGAMAVCDPVSGMHGLFKQVLPQHYFAERPALAYTDNWDESDIAPLRELLQRHHAEIAAVILEPIVQGAGGMWFYTADYLKAARHLCDEFDVLLICDEIATGFGRTGRLFACEHAAISPDIMCLGKALTGGYMTLAATLATRQVADTIAGNGAGVFMHGPTFMANPLACSVALASIELLLQNDWQQQVADIEAGLQQGLRACAALPQVRDVRVLGAIGVVELRQAVDMQQIMPLFVERGVWVRPFGKLIYVMPPYIISAADLAQLTDAIHEVITLSNGKGA
ncbi:MAG: adenosylmethionine--8-amino-7-oxononanoate transaminase [Gammaproteobacteria bacterium]